MDIIKQSRRRLFQLSARNYLSISVLFAGDFGSLVMPSKFNEISVPNAPLRRDLTDPPSFAVPQSWRNYLLAAKI